MRRQKAEVVGFQRQLHQELRENTYRPQAVRRLEIPTAAEDSPTRINSQLQIVVEWSARYRLLVHPAEPVGVLGWQS
jgi:hypothetical protein